MNQPKLAICNFIEDAGELKKLALSLGVSAIDWTFKRDDLPGTPLAEAGIARDIALFDDFEIRYHCAFNGIDLGDSAKEKADEAEQIFMSACRLIHALGGKFMTIHIGLGRDCTQGLSWERSLRRLSKLVQFGQNIGVTVCLENLASGWSSRPELFEKLVRKTDCCVTLDIGHARVSPSVSCEQYAFEDFVLPHAQRIRNAHIYHEEKDDGHVAPQSVDDVKQRLDIMYRLPCDWWTLELREKEPLIETLRVVRKYLEQASSADSNGDTDTRNRSDIPQIF